MSPSPQPLFRQLKQLTLFHLQCFLSLSLPLFFRVHEHPSPVLQHLFHVLPHWTGHLAGLLPASLLQGQEVDRVMRLSLLPPGISASRTPLGRAWPTQLKAILLTVPPRHSGAFLPELISFGVGEYGTPPTPSKSMRTSF